MWAAASAAALVGFVLNCFMVTTWAAFDVQMADLASLAIVGNIYLGQALPQSEPWNSFAFPICDVSANPTEISVAETQKLQMRFSLGVGRVQLTFRTFTSTSR